MGLHQILALVLAFLALGLGVLYYGLYRQTELPTLLGWLSNPVFSSAKPIEPGAYGQSIPSLLHAIASILIMRVFVSRTTIRGMPVSLAMFLALLLFEYTIGHTNISDMLFIAVGVMVAECVWYGLSQLRADASYCAGKLSQRLSMLAAVSFSGLLAAGSSYWGDYHHAECAYYEDSGYCSEYKRDGMPVYMSYEVLRNAVEIQAARPPDRLGRLYVYGDYIFLNEVNEGIHVIDNHDPSQPVNKGFIRIPGNMDIAVRGDYLYADSYVDLLTLDLSEPNDIREVNRQQSLFPYNAYQNIPYNVVLAQSQLNQQRGVVVGYTLAEQ